MAGIVAGGWGLFFTQRWREARAVRRVLRDLALTVGIVPEYTESNDALRQRIRARLTGWP